MHDIKRYEGEEKRQKGINCSGTNDLRHSCGIRVRGGGDAPRGGFRIVREPKRDERGRPAGRLKGGDIG